MRSKAGNMAAFFFLTLSPLVRRILEWLLFTETTNSHQARNHCPGLLSILVELISEYAGEKFFLESNLSPIRRRDYDYRE